MILPSGVNKMSGLTAALREMQISPHNVVGIGDAENDHAFLGGCECWLWRMRSRPCGKRPISLRRRRTAKVWSRLIEKLLADDLNEIAAGLSRHDVAMGTVPGADRPASAALKPFGTAALICGQSGSGKSSLVAGIVERIVAKGYQVCLIDPEGDFEEADEFLATGDPKHGPSLDHIENLLSDPEAQVAVNMVGVSVEERSGLFGRVLALVHEHRMRTGRPHRVVVDEAHHMFPREWSAGGVALGKLWQRSAGHRAPGTGFTANTRGDQHGNCGG